MTPTEIANLALSNVGVGDEIGFLKTDSSNEASAMRRWFYVALKAVLRDYWWPFATKTATLERVCQFPTPDWQWSYRYPSDCLRFRRFVTGARNFTAQNEVPFRIVDDAKGKLIYTDWPYTNGNPNVGTLPPPVPNNLILPITEVQIPWFPATGEYTAIVENDGEYPEDFSIALSYRLAALAIPRLSVSDPYKLRPVLMQLYQVELSKALANAANEEQMDQRPDADTIRVRNPWGDQMGGEWP